MRYVQSDSVQTKWRIVNWPAWSRWILTACFFVAMNWMLLAPADTFQSVPFLFEHEDKLVHTASFLALAWLVRWAAPERCCFGLPQGGVLAALLVYAGAIESLQPLLGGAGRQFEWLDMASNIAGIAAGWVLMGAMVNPKGEDCGRARGGVGGG